MGWKTVNCPCGHKHYVYKQDGKKDCGAACLRTAYRYLKGEDITGKLNVPADADQSEMFAAAKSIQLNLSHVLKVNVFKADSKIVHLMNYRTKKAGHWVLALHSDGTQVTIFDPWDGSLTRVADIDNYTGKAVKSEKSAKLPPQAGVYEIKEPMAADFMSTPFETKAKSKPRF